MHAHWSTFLNRDGKKPLYKINVEIPADLDTRAILSGWEEKIRIGRGRVWVTAKHCKLDLSLSFIKSGWALARTMIRYDIGYALSSPTCLFFS